MVTTGAHVSPLRPLTTLASSMGSGAISTGQVVGVAKDAWTIGNDAYDAYKAGKDAWQQLKSR